MTVQASSRLRSFLPPSRAARVYALAAGVDALGTGVYFAAAVIYFALVVDLTPTQIGMALTAAGVVRFAATVPLGALGDRWGVSRTLVLFYSWRAICACCLGFATSWLWLTLALCAASLVEGASTPLTQAAIGEAVAPRDRVRTMAIVRTIRNIGFALGSATATVLVASPTRMAFLITVLINAATFVVVAAAIARLPLDPARISVLRTPVFAGVRRAVKDRPFLILASLNGVLSLHMSILSVGMPLWLLQHTELRPSFIPALIVVNTILAVVFQVPLSSLAREDGSVALGLTGVALAACCGAFAVSGLLSPVGAAAVALMGVVLLTLGEIWQAAGDWELSYRLSPEENRASYLSLFSLGTAMQELAGPVILTAGIVGAGSVGWLVLGAFVLAAGTGARVLVRRMSS